MRENPIDLIQVSKRFPGKTVKRPIGIYDNELLCEHCESKLSAIDNNGAEIFLRREPSVIAGDEKTGCTYEMKNVEVLRLKHFLVSVLWRAIASTRPEFESVAIAGVNRSKAKKITFNGLMPHHSLFPFLILRYLPSKIGSTVANPSTFLVGREKWANLYFPVHCVWLYVGVGAIPDIFRKIEAYSGSTIYMYGIPYEKSSSFKVAMNIVNNAEIF